MSSPGHLPDGCILANLGVAAHEPRDHCQAALLLRRGLPPSVADQDRRCEGDCEPPRNCRLALRPFQSHCFHGIPPGSGCYVLSSPSTGPTCRGKTSTAMHAASFADAKLLICQEIGPHP